MRKSMLDELVADYMGLVEAMGAFDARTFLRFMGLESFPAYRDGGRLENYRGDPPVGDEPFRVLQRVVARAALRLAEMDAARRLGPLRAGDKARVVTALFLVGLEGLACSEAEALLSAALHRAPTGPPIAADTAAAM